MRSSRSGRLLVGLYSRMPFRSLVLRAVVKREGGDIYSVTLRSVLRKFHGVEVGDYSYGSLIWPGACDRNSKIGRYVSIGPNVRRFGAAHPVEKVVMHPFGYNPSLGYVPASSDVERSSIDIGDDCWIGANVVILPSVSRIGVGSVIGAGAVVTRDVADFSIVVGVPARVVGRRFNEDICDQLIAENPWRAAPREMLSHSSRLERLLVDRRIV